MPLTSTNELKLMMAIGVVTLSIVRPPQEFFMIAKGEQQEGESWGGRKL